MCLAACGGGATRGVASHRTVSSTWKRFWKRLDGDGPVSLDVMPQAVISSAPSWRRSVARPAVSPELA